MGRFRSTARFIFSIGGTDGISPIARESEQSRLIRKPFPRPHRRQERPRYCASRKNQTTASPDGFGALRACR
jgi:hypothetical protein